MKVSGGQDSIGGLCRLAALLEQGIEAALSGRRDRLAQIQSDADKVTKSLMHGVFHDFITPLGRGDTGAAALSLYRCIMILPGCGDKTGKSAGCTGLCSAIRMCCSALRGRGRGDCGLDRYIAAVSVNSMTDGSPWERLEAELCRTYEVVCVALLNSV
ncbi:MAG: hypothetical protein PUJ09_05600 [Eubacteriales bacterium]|nr:hypothetical protein [Eubacteriales bacterium]